MAETGTSRPYGTVRNLIRSHARRGGNKQSRAGGSDPLLLDDQGTKHRNTRVSMRYKQKFQTAQVIRSPGNNTFNPFSILPAGERGHALTLINHCAFILPPHFLGRLYLPQKAFLGILEKLPQSRKS